MKNIKLNKSSFQYLFRNYAWPLRKAIISLIPITLIANIFVAVQPVALSGIMAIIMGDGNASAKPANSKLLDLNYIGSRVINFLSSFSQDKWNSMLILVGIFIILVALSAVLNYITYLLAIKIEARAIKLIQTDVMRHLLSLSMSFFNHQKTGSLISRINLDARSTATGLGPLTIGILRDTVLIVVYICYLLNTNALLTAVAFVLILAHFAVTQLIKSPVEKTVHSYLDKAAAFSNALHEIFTSIRVVKSFGGEKAEEQKIDREVEAYTDSFIRLNCVKQIQEPVRILLDALAMVGIVLIAAQQLMKGALSIQGFALFIFVGQQLINPINKLAVSISWIYALMASYSRINDLLEIKPQVVTGTTVKNDFVREIEIKGLSFSYGKDSVLSDISFRVEKGEIVAIVGPSGAGKSTLVDLILRFYDSQEGGIYIDNINLKEVKFEEYRRIFGVVPQQNILFNETIKDNIIYGRPYLSDNEVIKAAEIANAHKFITELPKGYDTIVGERGLLLSGGQCQRIAIARAVVSKPAILILDEATSSLDSDSEKQVQMAIDKVLENSTAIVIAHRLSTILHADKIVVLDKGKIEAIGKHNELIESSSTYRRLYNLQFKH